MRGIVVAAIVIAFCPANLALAQSLQDQLSAERPVALVKAANLQSLTSTTQLPASVSDYAQIPSEYRGYVAVAMQKGFLTLDGNGFAPNRALTRLELAQALVKLSKMAIE